MNLSSAGARRRVLVLVAGFAALVACRPGRPVTTPQARLGSFAFSAQTPQVEVTGTLLVLPDTVTIDSRLGQCRVPLQPNSLQAFRYECLGVGDYDLFVVTLDRMNPVTRSTWQARWTVQRLRTECTAWSINASGQRVCVATSQVAYDAPVSASGKLWIKRSVDAPERGA